MFFGSSLFFRLPLTMLRRVGARRPFRFWFRFSRRTTQLPSGWSCLLRLSLRRAEMATKTPRLPSLRACQNLCAPFFPPTLSGLPLPSRLPLRPLLPTRATTSAAPRVRLVTSSSAWPTGSSRLVEPETPPTSRPRPGSTSAQRWRSLPTPMYPSTLCWTLSRRPRALPSPAGGAPPTWSLTRHSRRPPRPTRLTRSSRPSSSVWPPPRPKPLPAGPGSRPAPL